MVALNVNSILRFATLNLCLGIKYKKELVKDLLLKNKIDILAVQEIEVEADFNLDLLSIPGYSFEAENNNVKCRVGMYISNSIKYMRCVNLEGLNNHLVVIDVKNVGKGKDEKLRFINIYRSFNPIGCNAKVK